MNLKYNNKPIKNKKHLIKILNKPNEENTLMLNGINHLIKLDIFNKPNEENILLNGIDNLIELDNIENEITFNEFNNKIEKDI